MSGLNANDPASVIFSLNLAETGSAGFAFVHSDTASGFDRTGYAVPAASLQNAVSQEGLKGRVVTAISYDGTQATFFSYGWSGDPSSVYEAQVDFATLGTSTAEIETLASQGYILTASGNTADGSGVILVGTRLKGDTMPRPVLVGDVIGGDVEAVLHQGYSVVAVVQQTGPNGMLLFNNYIGER